MSALRLPWCQVQYPTCGACGDETAHDGDSYYCQGCGLDYGNGADETIAYYRDEEAEPCARPCDNDWHKDDAIKSGYTFECAPCSLPKGHTSDHWTPCKMRKDTP